MRSLARVILASLTLSGCTAPIEAESIELDEQLTEREPAPPSWSHVPDALPAPADPEGQPRLVLELGPIGSEEERQYFCPYAVEARNFPALDVEGTTIVHIDLRDEGASAGEHQSMVLSHLQLGQAAREQLVYARGDDFEDYDGPSHCDEAIQQLREDVDAINAELASRTWRPLERLDVMPIDSLFIYAEDVIERIEALPLDRRPVEVLYRGDHFIVRVRQAKVLLELDRPDWQVDDPFCARNPKINGITFDRRSGLALVEYDHNSGACLCYSEDYVEMLQLPSELFDEVERRPTAVLEDPAEPAEQAEQQPE